MALMCFGLGGNFKTSIEILGCLRHCYILLSINSLRLIRLGSFFLAHRVHRERLRAEELAIVMNVCVNTWTRQT